MPKTGRSGDLPSRVFVISGTTNKNNTSLSSSEVQEWSLDDMTVRKLQPLVPSRTSYACYHKIKDRHIYVLGGNQSSNYPLNDVQRFDIFSKQWQQLPGMCEQRANCSVIIPEGSKFLYAFGGYNNNYNASAVTNTIEQLNVVDSIEKQKWKIVQLKMNSDAKACNYMYQLDSQSILIFGGW